MKTKINLAILFFTGLIFLLFSCSSSKKAHVSDEPYDVVVFEPNELYTSTRIPALVFTKQRSLLAFCEGRIGTASDWADMNLLMRRSIDKGKTWSEVHVLDSMKGGPVGNPTPIVDNDGVIHLLYQKDYARAFYIKSENDGLSWTAPVEITETYNQFRPEYQWKVIAPGPGHGIQLKNGRLVAATWMANSSTTTPRRRHAPSCVATIYSDDNGKTWKRGAIVADSSSEISNPNESMLLQLSDGRVMISIRNTSSIKRRAFSYSDDGISNWSTARFEQELFDPTCMASIISIPKIDNKSAVLFLNPDSKDIPKTPRRNLTAKLSFDGGNTWPVIKVINSGASGYSDMALGEENTIYCLYETNTNKNGWNYSLVMKRIDDRWLLK